MKIRIVLECKRDIPSSYKIGDRICIYNDIFDTQNGIAFFPIDREEWRVVSSHMFTGMYDINDKGIYEGDNVSDSEEGIVGEVIFDDACFVVRVSDYLDGIETTFYEIGDEQILSLFKNLCVTKTPV